MKALRYVILSAVLLASGWFLGSSYEKSNTAAHVDWMCGTITGNDGTREPVKISIENEMSFDLRQYPGMIYLKRCESNTPLAEIK